MLNLNVTRCNNYNWLHSNSVSVYTNA